MNNKPTSTWERKNNLIRKRKTIKILIQLKKRKQHKILKYFIIFYPTCIKETLTTEDSMLYDSRYKWKRQKQIEIWDGEGQIEICHKFQLLMINDYTITTDQQLWSNVIKIMIDFFLSENNDRLIALIAQ